MDYGMLFPASRARRPSSDISVAFSATYRITESFPAPTGYAYHSCGRIEERQMTGYALITTTIWLYARLTATRLFFRGRLDHKDVTRYTASRW